MRRALLAAFLLLAATLLRMSVMLPPAGARPAPPPPSQSFFSIVVFTDIHVNSIPQADVDWGIASDWVSNSTNIGAWNIQGAMTTGDNMQNIGAACSCDDSDAEWNVLVAGYNKLIAAGVPFVITPGNHDVQFTKHTKWDTFTAPLNASEATFYAQSSNIGSMAGDHTAAANTYLRVNAATTTGTYKMGLVGFQWRASSADISQVRTWMDADTDRQFIAGTHFITIGAAEATMPANDVHLCQYGECMGANSVGALDGVDMWNGLKGNPRIVAMMSGHWHYIVYLPLTLTSGAVIPSFANYNEASPPNTASIVTILKFRPADHKMDIISWNTMSDTPDTRWNGTGTASYDWNPLTSPAVGGSTVGGAAKLSGSGVGGQPE